MARGGKADKPQTRYPPDDSGEEFDFQSVDRQDLSSESSASPLEPSSAALPPPTVASDSPTRETSPELFDPPSKTSSRRTAEDIEYFFTRGDEKEGTKTICNVCKYVITFPRGDKFLMRCRVISEHSKSNPGGFHINFQFSAKTANSTLRVHLDRNHKVEYLRLHKERGWKSQLKSMEDAETESTPVSEVPSDVFSLETFLDHLVRFIVADDQVSTLRCHLYHADFSPLVDLRY
ncbi:hypothetical protein BC826DRAFT_970521 [Russula brevipes]|nr:hypothetical protein BC826DRAFT_970521 [Russula brevipes]